VLVKSTLPDAAAPAISDVNMGLVDEVYPALPEVTGVVPVVPVVSSTDTLPSSVFGAAG
jgi:hypothetical protein